jgi:hypothetical protein
MKQVATVDQLVHDVTQALGEVVRWPNVATRIESAANSIHLLETALRSSPKKLVDGAVLIIVAGILSEPEGTKAGRVAAWAMLERLFVIGAEKP